MFKIAINTIAKQFNGYIVIIVEINFPGIFANIFQRKIIPGNSMCAPAAPWVYYRSTTGLPQTYHRLTTDIQNCIKRQ